MIARCLYATHVHGGQVRKGTSTPYIAHLLAVSATVLEYGGGENLAIAALLHDSVEDQGGKARLEDVRNRFGDPVAHIVAACSDSLADTAKGEQKAGWQDQVLRELEGANLSPTTEYETPLNACSDVAISVRYGVSRMASMAVYRFVVHAPDLEKPWKVFTTRAEAHAEASRLVAGDAREATIYESPDLERFPEGTRTYAAKAAIEQGEGTFIEKKVARATEIQVRRVAERLFPRPEAAIYSPPMFRRSGTKRSINSRPAPDIGEVILFERTNMLKYLELVKNS